MGADRDGLVLTVPDGEVWCGGRGTSDGQAVPHAPPRLHVCRVLPSSPPRPHLTRLAAAPEQIVVKVLPEFIRDDVERQRINTGVHEREAERR